MTNAITLIKTTQQFDSLISSFEHPVLVIFGADWCRPCNTLQKALENKLVCSFGWIAAKIDVDNECTEDIVARHEVSSVPSAFLYHKGDLIDSVDAYFQGSSEDKLTKMIDLANNNSSKPTCNPSL